MTASDQATDQSYLRRVLSPRSVAVIGASERGLGGITLENMRRDFRGTVYPVNPARESVAGLKAFASVDDVPEPADLAVIVVPAPSVPGIVDRCADLGFGGALVLSAGFSETGAQGASLQARLRRTAEERRFPVIGPNCNGFINGPARARATFAVLASAPAPADGGVALVSQSGGFGAYILNKSMSSGLDLGWYVTTGNEVGVSAAQVLRYLVEDDSVRIVLLYLEGVRDPEIFIAALDRAAELGKPVVGVKAGTTAGGSKAALSHTASIAGASDVYDSVCRQYGLIQADSVEQMIDFGLALQTGKRMRGDRVGVVTPSGGAGVLMADEATRVGMTLPELGQADRQRIAEIIPSFGSAVNPVDLTGGATLDPTIFARVMTTLAGAQNIDGLVPLVWRVDPEEEAAVLEVHEKSDKPVVVAVTNDAPGLSSAGVPVYGDPARAIRALGAVHQFSGIAGRHSRRPTAEVDTARAARARAILGRSAGRVVLESDAKQVLDLYGVPVSRERVAQSAGEAAKAAAEIGFPVALKVLSAELTHKSDAGGLRLGLAGPAEVETAFAQLQARFGAGSGTSLDGILVQEMVPASIEMMFGLQRDPVFGAMVVVALGGVLVEITANSAMLRAPFRPQDAEEILSGLWEGRLTSSARGLTREQTAELARIMSGIGQLGLELPEIESVDVNPVRVSAGRCAAVDALIVRSTETAAAS